MHDRIAALDRCAEACRVGDVTADDLAVHVLEPPRALHVSDDCSHSLAGSRELADDMPADEAARARDENQSVTSKFFQ